MMKIFEILAKIIHFLKTLIYVFLTMLVLSILFGYSHLKDSVLLLLLMGILWSVWLLVVDFAFSPRQSGDGDTLPSRIKSSGTSNAMRQFSIVFLGVCFLLLTGFSVQMFL